MRHEVMRTFCVEQRVIRNYHAFTDHGTYPLPWIEHFLVYPNTPLCPLCDGSVVSFRCDIVGNIFGIPGMEEECFEVWPYLLECPMFGKDVCWVLCSFDVIETE